MVPFHSAISALCAEMTKPKKEESGLLVGWQQIADFLGQPFSVAQRWAKSGMPVSREGRRVHALPEELNRWLGCESGNEPVQIATECPDLSSELKRGLSFIKKHKPRSLLKVSCTLATVESFTNH
jgi:hypothetical protein